MAVGVSGAGITWTLPMRLSSPRWRASLPASAQPTQPLPNLCPTSEAAPLLTLPNLPDLFGFRAYIGIRSAMNRHLYIREKRLGRLGRLGEANRGKGFRCPTSPASGWAGGKRLGSAAVSAQQQGQVAPVRGSSWSLPHCGLHGRNFPPVTERAVWFSRWLSGSVSRFNGWTA